MYRLLHERSIIVDSFMEHVKLQEFIEIKY